MSSLLLSKSSVLVYGLSRMLMLYAVTVVVIRDSLFYEPIECCGVHDDFTCTEMSYLSLAGISSVSVLP